MGIFSRKDNSTPKKSTLQNVERPKVAHPKGESGKISSKDTQDDDLRKEIFNRILDIFRTSDVFQHSSRIFVVYAHEPQGTHEATKEYIQWFKDIRFNILSDKSPCGYGPGRISAGSPDVRTSNAAGNILDNQFCLLPRRHFRNSVRYVIVCGSELLGTYMQNEQFQDYMADMEKVYKNNPKDSEGERCKLVRDVYNKHEKIMKNKFHHVFTELALLNLRTEEEKRETIRPLLLNGDYTKCFPSYITKDKTILRVEQNADREQHTCFFKLLAEVAPDEKRYIDELSKCYERNCSLLKSRQPNLNIDQFRTDCEIQNFKALRVLSNDQDPGLSRRRVEIASVYVALRKYYSDGPLSIQRVSGQPLSVDKNFFDLVMLPYIKSQPWGNGKSSVLPPRLSMDKVPLKNLFHARTMPNGEVRSPRRILIRGSPGVGKSTICKRIVSDFQKNDALRDVFEWVLWIPLSKLELAGDLEKFFYKEYFQFIDCGKELATTLLNQILREEKSKTLLILDGWDETHGNQEHRAGLISRLANYHSVIITSRFSGYFDNVNPFDLELDVLGFTPEEVSKCLNILAPSNAGEMKQFFEKNFWVQELAKIPLCLDMICYSWNELNNSNFRNAPTVTKLYQTIVRKLWQMDIPILGKRDSHTGPPLTNRHVQMVETNCLENIVQTEVEFLGRLAIILSDQKQTTCDLLTVQRITSLMRAKGSKLPPTFEATLSKLSLLQIHGSGTQASYNFIHPTFQEYFAAHRLTQDERQLDVSIPEKTPESAFVVTWSFVAGLLESKNDEKLIHRFFHKIRKWDIWAIAPCLGQVSSNRSSKELESLRQRVQTWQEAKEKENRKRQEDRRIREVDRTNLIWAGHNDTAMFNAIQRQEDRRAEWEAIQTQAANERRVAQMEIESSYNSIMETQGVSILDGFFMGPPSKHF